MKDVGTYFSLQGITDATNLTIDTRGHLLDDYYSLTGIEKFSCGTYTIRDSTGSGKGFENL